MTYFPGEIDPQAKLTALLEEVPSNQVHSEEPIPPDNELATDRPFLPEELDELVAEDTLLLEWQAAQITAPISTEVTIDITSDELVLVMPGVADASAKTPVTVAAQSTEREPFGGWPAKGSRAYAPRNAITDPRPYHPDEVSYDNSLLDMQPAENAATTEVGSEESSEEPHRFLTNEEPETPRSNSKRFRNFMQKSAAALKQQWQDRVGVKTSDEWLYRKERRQRAATIGSAVAIVAVGLLAAVHSNASDDQSAEATLKSATPSTSASIETTNSVATTPELAEQSPATTAPSVSVQAGNSEAEPHPITAETYELMKTPEFGSFVVYMSIPGNTVDTFDRDVNIVWNQQVQNTSPVLELLRDFS